MLGSLGACGPVHEDSSATSGPSPTSETSSASAGVTTNDSTPSTSADATGMPHDPSHGTGTTEASSSTGPSTTGEHGGADGFIPSLDGGSGICDIWAQDCATGEKCTPWADDGGNSWNATRCVPLAPDPKHVGDVCSVEGVINSGLDDCELGSMCWNVDPETNLGECVGFCVGIEADPMCEDPCRTCVISNSGVLPLCLESCDPLLQNCPEGDACYPDGDTFSCVPDTGGEQPLLGDPCQPSELCDPGLFCAPAASLPACIAEWGCCAAFCDLDANEICTTPGAVCVPWYGDGGPPIGCEIQTNLGACLAPR